MYQFDGWPAFVFSGWPGVSYGTYSSEIVAFDRVLSENGKFRILAKSIGKPWPEAIQLGGGVEGFALLNNVPLIYQCGIVDFFNTCFPQPGSITYTNNSLHIFYGVATFLPFLYDCSILFRLVFGFGAVLMFIYESMSSAVGGLCL